MRAQEAMKDSISGSEVKAGFQKESVFERLGGRIHLE